MLKDSDTVGRARIISHRCKSDQRNLYWIANEYIVKLLNGQSLAILCR